MTSFELTLVREIFGKPATDRLWTGAVVVQGPYHKPSTERAIREFLDRNPADVLVILSSYVPHNPQELLSAYEMDQLINSRSLHFGRFVCIACSTPSRDDHREFWQSNLSNQNLQRLSSFAGFQFAASLGIQVVLKMRSDAFLAMGNCCKQLRSIVDQYPVSPDPISEDRRKMAGVDSQRARILVSDLCVLVDDRNPTWTCMGRYFIADVWSFGYVEDMMRYFDVRDSSLWNRGIGMPVNSLAETNLATCWKNEMRLREDMRLLEILSRYFVVSHHNVALFFWPRWWDYNEAKKVGLEFFLTSRPWNYPERFTNEQWIDSVRT